jgi:peptide/nickel transport system ATP-binding protein
MTDTPILQIEALRTYFKTGSGIAKAVDGVTFSIQPGETYALVGESGCGKSVTALSILQLVAKPAGYIAGGHILFKGRELSNLPPIEMRKVRGNQISMIFQEPMTALNPVFTVGHQIAETIMLHQKITRSEASRKSIEMLERVGIPDPLQRFREYPHQMSGGMRQRVMIAMALACRPELLIADEPTTALDVTIQAQILKLIRDLQKELGTAVLMITHDMGVVHENADRIGVMYAGRIVESANRTDLFTASAHPYTQLLLRSLPSRSRRDRPLDTIKGMVPKATGFPPGCRFNNRCPLVMERCRREQPHSYAAGPGHSAECFLLEDSASDRTISVDGHLSPSPPPAVDTKTTRLELKDLKMHFPITKGLFKHTVANVRAVDGVTFSIHKGETLALVGESGCGKTTVGKCLVRLLDPTGGAVLFHSTEIQNLARGPMKPFRRSMQMIFQDPFSSLNPRMTIGQTIIEGMETHRLGTSKRDMLERTRNIMFRVGLDPDMVSRYPHEFSGGQRQRIGLARALAVDPELVICDEATSSLDVSVQAQILNLLKKLQSELGLSYLFITHDLSVVKYLANRVAVMYLGRIVEEGTTEEIFEAARHPYTQALLSAIPKIDEETAQGSIVVAGDVPSPVNPPRGCHFHPRCPRVRGECRNDYPGIYDLSATHKCRCVLCANPDYSAAGGDSGFTSWAG